MIARVNVLTSLITLTLLLSTQAVAEISIGVRELYNPGDFIDIYASEVFAELSHFGVLSSEFAGGISGDRDSLEDHFLDRPHFLYSLKLYLELTRNARPFIGGGFGYYKGKVRFPVEEGGVETLEIAEEYDEYDFSAQHLLGGVRFRLGDHLGLQLVIRYLFHETDVYDEEPGKLMLGASLVGVFGQGWETGWGCMPGGRRAEPCYCQYDGCPKKDCKCNMTGTEYRCLCNKKHCTSDVCANYEKILCSSAPAPKPRHQPCRGAAARPAVSCDPPCGFTGCDCAEADVCPHLPAKDCSNMTTVLSCPCGGKNCRCPGEMYCKRPKVDRKHTKPCKGKVPFGTYEGWCNSAAP